MASALGADVDRMLAGPRAAVEFLATKFGITDVGGWRPSDPFPDHPGGYAADLMTRQGQPLADYAVANATALNVDYVIWNRKIWSAARAKEGWRPYTSTDNPHTDHVHITFKKAGGITLLGLKDTATAAVGDVAGKLFDLDGLMNAVKGSTITLMAAGLGLALIGFGLAAAVRPAVTTKAKQAIGIGGG